jgi:hypothetical protein
MDPVTDLTAEALAWERTDDGEFPYTAIHDGQRLRIRVNDFPAEPLYTLIADDHEVVDLREGVRIHWDSARPVHYEVETSESQYVCTVTAYFRESENTAERVLLQRRPR